LLIAERWKEIEKIRRSKEIEFRKQGRVKREDGRREIWESASSCGEMIMLNLCEPRKNFAYYSERKKASNE